jgi:HEAT repeat protein
MRTTNPPHSSPLTPHASRRLTHYAPRLTGALLLLVAVVYFAALVPYGLNIDDEGTILYQIFRTYLGQLLYVDFHAGYTPGLFYWNAALFSLFGVNVLVLRLCLAVINGLSVYCLYWLARRLAASRPAAAAAGLLYLAFIPFYDGQFAAFNIPYPIWYVTLFWLLSVICAVRWWESGRMLLWLPAGVCAGVVFAFKPNSGLLNLAALLIALTLLERPDPALGRGSGWLSRWVASCERPVRWLIPLALSGALTLLFRGAGGREVTLFAVPLLVLVAYQLFVPRGRDLARPVAPGTLWRNLLLLGAGFAVVTLPWTVYFWAHLGTWPFLRAILFVGTGFARFYYMPYPPIGTFGLATAAAMALAVTVGVLVRKGVLSRRLVAGGIVAGLMAVAVWLLRHPPPMVEGFQSSVVMRLRDIAFVVILATEWAALLAYVVQSWRGRAFSLVAPLDNGSAGAAGSEAHRPALGVLLILLVSAALTHMQLYPRTDFMHLVTAAPGILILGAWLLHLLAQVWARGMARTPAGRAAVAAAVLSPVYALILILVAPALGRITYLARAWWTHDQTALVALDSTRAPLVLEPAAARPFLALSSTARYLREHSRPDEAVFTFPALDIVCFLADRQNPTRHDYFFPGWPGHDVEAEVVDSLRAHPPRYIVTLHDHPLFFAAAPVYYVSLRGYVTGEYSLERRIDTVDILRLGPDAHEPAGGDDGDGLADVIGLWRAELHHQPGATARRVDATLARLPASTMPALAAAIAASDTAAQRTLAQLIRKSRSAGGAAALAVVLENYRLPDTLRQLFIRIIAECGDARAVVPLLGGLANADPRERLEYAGLLFTIGRKLSLENYWYAQSNRGELAAIVPALNMRQLIRWIDNPWESYALRSFAIRMAGRQPDRKVIPFLARVLGDTEEFPDLRVQAAGSLVELGFGPQVLPAIVSLLPDDQVVPAALTVAVYHQNLEAGREALAEQMAATDDATRAAAFWIAAAVHDRELTAILREGLQDPLQQVRIAAAWALGNLADTGSLAALQQVAHDDNDQVAAFARRAIEKIGEGSGVRGKG